MVSESCRKLKKLISQKKKIYPISNHFDQYLRYFNRSFRLPLQYEELLRFSDSFSLYDKQGEDTLWVSVSYPPSEQKDIFERLLIVYAYLRSGGSTNNLKHLIVDRLDLCLYGNTKPFRVRIVNTLNENFDYYYIKEADASRLYGLELEHILSPNRIEFMYYENTLIEEHIYGIPGDAFIGKYLNAPDSNKVRLAKEFVKFNERCFIRLLGDMHSANFVVDVTMDFEENYYRIRGIDFDQQSYEASKKVYLPQFFPQNYAYVRLAMDHLSPESIEQYKKEEQALIRQRVLSSSYRINRLLSIMCQDTIAPFANVSALAKTLAKHYRNDEFYKCRSMGELVAKSLEQLGESSSQG